MNFKVKHTNFNVFNLEESVAFYKKALGLHETGRNHEKTGKYINVYLCDEDEKYVIELSWVRDRTEPYNLGDNEIHLALSVDDFEAAYAHHKAMGCICFENKEMGIYFISDPDGYWIEIVPQKK